MPPTHMRTPASSWSARGASGQGRPAAAWSGYSASSASVMGAATAIIGMVARKRYRSWAGGLGRGQSGHGPATGHRGGARWRGARRPRARGTPSHAERGVERDRDVPRDLDRRRERERRERPSQPPSETPDTGRSRDRREEPGRQAEQPQHGHDQDQQQVLDHVRRERHVLRPFGERARAAPPPGSAVAATNAASAPARGRRSPPPAPPQRAHRHEVAHQDDLQAEHDFRVPVTGRPRGSPRARGRDARGSEVAEQPEET